MILALCVVRVQLMLDGSFSVSRRTWIDTEGSRGTKRPWSVGLEADNISLLIGTLALSVCLSVCLLYTFQQSLETLLFSRSFPRYFPTYLDIGRPFPVDLVTAFTT